MPWRLSEALWSILLIGCGILTADVLRFALGFIYAVFVGLQVVVYSWWNG
jgi:hypothetical protein